MLPVTLSSSSRRASPSPSLSCPAISSAGAPRAGSARHRRRASRRPALALHRARARRPLHAVAGSSSASRGVPTSAPPAAASGRRPTAASTWRPVSDGSSRPRRSAPSPSPNRIPTSSTSGWAKTQLRGNIIQGDGVYKTTDAGKTWTHVGLEKTHGDRPHPRPSRPTPTSSTSPRSAIRTARTPSAACSRPTDGGKTWDTRAVPRRQDRRGRSRRWIRRTPTCSTPGSGKSSARRIRCRAAARAAACSRRTDGGSDLDRADEEPRPADAALGQGRRRRSRAPTPTASTRSSRPPDGGVFLSDDAGATWKLRQRRPPASASARSTTRASTPTRRRRTRSTSSTSGSTDRPTPARRSAAIRVPHGDNHDLWIAPNDPQADGQQQRRRRQRLDQRRRELDRPGLSDRAVLQRLHHRARAVSRLRRAAGQHAPPASRAPAPASSTPSAAARAATSRRIPQDTDVFYAGSYGGLLTRINRRTGERRDDQRLARQPDGHSSSDITERFQWTFPIVIAPTDPKTLYVDVAARLEVDQRRAELAADQPRPDAPRSRRRWGPRADRSRSTRPASRPTRRSSPSRRRRSTAT